MTTSWFPGRWLGGATLIVAPLLLLGGILLRLPVSFFFPAQLAAYAAEPTRFAVAYGAIAAGNALLWPAVLALAGRIAATHAGWARWGAALTIFGLFARTFHAGVDHLAFQLVRARGTEAAEQVVASSYGAYHVFHAASPAIMAGWVVLAIGAHRAGVLGTARAVALGTMSALMIGVLKGSSIVSAIAAAGLCVALVPLGVRVLRDGPPQSARAIATRLALTSAGVAALYFLGEAG